MNVAKPELSSVPVAKTVAPSLNTTVPVGVPVPGAVAITLAVTITGWPYSEGLALEVTEVVEVAWFTSWLRFDDVLLVKFVSPA